MSPLKIILHGFPILKIKKIGVLFSQKKRNADCLAAVFKR